MTQGSLWDYTKQSYNNLGKFSSSAYQSSKTAVINTLQNPRFQGSMQAIGGLAEAGAGISAIVGTGFLMTAVGAPVAAHGMDSYFTGMRKLFSGTPQDTLTSQLLQKTGLSSNIAGMVDSGISMVESFGAIAAIRNTGQRAFSALRSTQDVTRNADTHVMLYRAVKPEELIDIQKTEAFRNFGSAEGKYFTTSRESASFYAKQAVKGF